MTTSDQTNAKQRKPARADLPDTTVSVREIFGFETDLEVPAFAERNEYVLIVADYLADKNTTLALLAGFAHNRRVMAGLSPPANRPISSKWRASQLAMCV